MNIGIIDRFFLQPRSGAETYTYYLAKALAANGHYVHIICEDGDFRIYSKEFFYNVRVHKIDFRGEFLSSAKIFDRLFPFNHLRFASAVSEKLQELVNSNQLDLIEGTDSDLESCFASRIKSKPLVIRVHADLPFLQIIDGAAKEGKPSFKEKRIKNMTKNMLMSAHALTAVSKDVAATAQSFYGITNPIDIVPNGIDVNSFPPGNFDQRDLNVFFCGRLEQKNGIAILGKAMALVLQKLPKTKFIFAGRDSKEETSQKMWGQVLAQNVPSENVIFLKEIPMESVKKYFQKNAVAVFPAIYESFGYLALESMACGCATVASGSGYLKDLITDGQDGILFPPGNHEALAQGIIKLLTEHPLRKKISEQAVLKTRQRFNLEEVIKSVIPVYEKAQLVFQKAKEDAAEKPFI